MKKNKVKWYKSLLFKVNWSIILILIIFILLLSFFINNLVSKEITKQVKEKNLEIATALQDNVNDFLDQTENIINVTSELEKIKTGNDQSILEVLKKIKKEYKHFKYIYVAKKSGQMIMHPQVKLGSDYIPQDRVWYQKAIEQNELIWTDSYLDANENYLMITVAIPIKNDNGEFIGVLAGDILLNDLSRTIADKKIGETGYAYITNEKGEVIAHPNAEFIKNKYNIDQVMNYNQILKKGKGFIKYKDSVNDKKLASYVSIKRLNGIIFAQMEVEEAFAVKDQLQLMILGISLLVLIVLGILFYLINKKYLLTPINKLINSIVEVAQGDFNSKVENIREDEIGKLASNFNYMIEEIHAAYQQLEAYNREITNLNQTLKFQADHDPLTELPNRRKFIRELEIELKKNKAGIIMLLDLDDFKDVNDTLGHIYGDKLLKRISHTLMDIANKNVFVARYGGDEFLILLKEITSDLKIKEYIKKLKEIIEEPFRINDKEVHIGFSLGITRYPQDSTTTYQLITNADTAMYEAKKMDDKDYLYYNQNMKNKMKKKKEIEDKLRNALNNDKFKLKYQPQVDLTDGQAKYFEALIRLKEDNISPGEFIPVAEESGLIIEIGRWVTKEAIEQLAIHEDNEIKISINFSVQQLNDKEYIDFLVEELNKNNVNPELLEIEITESVLIEKEAEAIEFLNQLSQLGVQLALDDFGTGYSSFSYLAYISFDKVKLDKFIIDRFLEGQNLKTIANLIKLFHSIDLPVVAEGVETKEQYINLAEMNCDYIQGYLFSKPLANNKIKKLLQENLIQEI
ncbi:bifunctional diguanylate cyclase/phosphodiesterase [Halanaerobacter jeridensis]|uniref:Diguanylate cyclase (GGDEF)-like protein n=1 Tax=Halanaerobacter jeridensis TaxID=706427 RepID=A0A939BNT1_9FIRM|nr:EAL domain-containing protein [Halanaerobacter jeridensis]MBM7555773.1 diguanylate cyclase (GGDEF)-like protein [Halanaerobacter jeridensis]